MCVICSKYYLTLTLNTSQMWTNLSSEYPYPKLKILEISQCDGAYNSSTLEPKPGGSQLPRQFSETLLRQREIKLVGGQP